MTIIVYSSKTGSSERYARALSESTGFAAFSVKDDYDHEQSIVFIGWIRGIALVGFDKVDRSKVIAVAAVALDDKPKKGWNRIKDLNEIKVPFYHLPGWIDRKKVGPVNKLLFCLLCVYYKLQGLDSRTKPLFDAMMNGGSFYDESRLEPLILFCKSH